MSETIQSGVFTLVMDRDVGKKDLSHFRSWGFLFMDQKNDLQVLTFEELEVMTDKKDPRKIYCHGLKPVLDDHKDARCIGEVTGILMCFVLGDGNREVSIHRDGTVQKVSSIPADHVVKIENCILEVSGKGKAEEHLETAYIEPVVVQGLHTYTVYYKFKEPLLKDLLTNGE